MKYNKGKAGPVSLNEIEISSILHCGSGPQAYGKGEAILKKANGDLKDVTFLVQGGNYQFHRERLVVGQKLRVPVRWTGGHAVTIVDTPALDKFRAENPRQAPATQNDVARDAA